MPLHAANMAPNHRACPTAVAMQDVSGMPATPPCSSPGPPLEVLRVPPLQPLGVDGVPPHAGGGAAARDAREAQASAWPQVGVPHAVWRGIRHRGDTTTR